ncbi:hypothetical protein PV04_04473 [Phialophora macrospora]|uniref:Transcription factor domain-containing protein n=1 Tax=Phialophora macrospora TaxID=1851006 RepID=A0A0D2G9G6_9EURO|nr:hypothetical protein PV04_04473 [Phialophora macrospora]
MLEERNLDAIEAQWLVDKFQHASEASWKFVDNTQDVINSHGQEDEAEAVDTRDDVDKVQYDGGGESLSTSSTTLSADADVAPDTNTAEHSASLPIDPTLESLSQGHSKEGAGPTFTEDPPASDGFSHVTSMHEGAGLDVVHSLNASGTPCLESVVHESAFTPPFSLGLALSRRPSPLHEIRCPIPEEQTLDLVKAYLAETATWCDTTDSFRHFAVLSAHDMLETGVFKAAALALASRQLSMVGRMDGDVPLQCYQYTIQLLIQQDPSHTNSCVLAACILLCVYEMMASNITDWRRHLKGCSSLFSSNGLNGSSEGLAKTCFWAFARIDLWAAFILHKRTLIPTHCWVDNESFQAAASLACPDDYCNLSILTFARLVNSLAVEESDTLDTSSELIHDAQTLWKAFQTWWELRPTRVKPLFNVPSGTANAFPRIIFIDPSSNCGHTFFHAGCILLLTERKYRPDEDNEMCDPLWHAAQLCGISISNTDHANWVNHLHPLFIAGRQFGTCRGQSDSVRGRGDMATLPTTRFISTFPSTSSNSRCGTMSRSATRHYRHEDEHVDNVRFAVQRITLLQHLVHIQRETGWRTEGRAKELRQLWGLE